MSLVAVSLAASAPVCAQDGGTDLFGPETVSVSGEFRLVAANGETSWIDGGYGKARFGSGRDLRVRPEPIEANLIWQPRFSWSLSGTVVATVQHGQEHAADLSEAFLTYKPLVGGRARLSLRAGLMWPSVSLEHSGADWHVTETITPSAINAWIGEEVKVGAVEANLSVPIGTHRVAATLALFGWNDTAGTLLALRGWAAHDQKATAFGLQQLPPLTGFIRNVQAPRTRPVLEIDHRPGWYARFSWSPMRALELQAFHYNNRGDPQSKTPVLQWGWDTRFHQLAAVVAMAPFELKAQAMRGHTTMGFNAAPSGIIWVDTKFQAAYVMATRHFKRGSVSLRGEAFGTRNRGSRLGGDWDEDGWSATAAVRRELGAHVSVLGEVAHIASRKKVRVTTGLNPRQAQTVAQLGARLHF